MIYNNRRNINKGLYLTDYYKQSTTVKLWNNYILPLLQAIPLAITIYVIVLLYTV